MSKNTDLVNRASQGDNEAADELYQDEEFQRELRRMAERWIWNKMRFKKDKVRVTELADEAFFKAVRGKKDGRWESIEQFRCYAAQNMLRMLQDMIRKKHLKMEPGGQQIMDNLADSD